jgi:hypothetical protein
MAARFLDFYESAHAVTLRDLWFFDLYRAFRALPELRFFEQGYVDLGLIELREPDLEVRLRKFIHHALNTAAA